MIHFWKILVVTMLISTSWTFGAGPAPTDSNPAKLSNRLEIPIPEKLRHLHLENPMVVYHVIISPGGVLVDSLAIEATHYDLLDVAEKKLSDAKFEPAIQDGVPQPSMIAVAVTFFDPIQRAWKSGGITIPMGSSALEGTENRMNLVGAEKNRYKESLPNELDEPLRMLKSELRMVHAEGQPMEKGKVTVEYYVNRKGEVRLPQIIKSDGEYLSMSALETLKRTVFAPPIRSGKPTYVKVRQPFNFD